MKMIILLYNYLQLYFGLSLAQNYLYKDSKDFSFLLSDLNSSKAFKSFGDYNFAFVDNCLNKFSSIQGDWELPRSRQSKFASEGLYILKNEDNTISRINLLKYNEIFSELQYDLTNALNTSIYPSLGGGSFNFGDDVFLRCPIVGFAPNNLIHYDWYFSPIGSELPIKLDSRRQLRNVDFSTNFIENGRWLQISLGNLIHYENPNRKLTRSGFGSYSCTGSLFNQGRLTRNLSSLSIPVLLNEQNFTAPRISLSTASQIRLQLPDLFEFLFTESIGPHSKCHKDMPRLFTRTGLAHEFLCYLNASPYVGHVRWYRNNKLITFPLKRHSIVHGGTLRIHPIQPDDSGVYHCSFRQYNLTSAAFRVLVEAESLRVKSTREIIYILQDVSHSNKQKTGIFCEFPSVNIRFKVLWFHNGTEIEKEKSSAYEIQTDFDSERGVTRSTLLIHRAEREHQGFLQCFILTGFKQYSRKFHLTIMPSRGLSHGQNELVSDIGYHERPPMSPEGLRLTKIEDDRAILVWSRPNDETFLEYTLNITDLQENRSIMRTVDTETIQLNDLRPQAKYTVQVHSLRKADSSRSLNGNEVTFTTREQLKRHGPVESIEAFAHEKRSMKITWKAPQASHETLGHNQLDHYLVIAKDLTNPDAPTITSKALDEFLIMSKLKPDAFFSVKIVAVSREGLEGYPAFLSSTPRVLSELPSRFPNQFRASSIGKTSIRLSWKNIEMDGEIFKNSLMIASDYWLNAREILVRRDLEEITLTNLLPDSQYQVNISAISRAGRGPFSPLVSVRTRLEPSQLDRDVDVMLKLLQSQPGSIDPDSIHQFSLEEDFHENFDSSKESVFHNNNGGDDRIENLQVTPNARHINLTWTYTRSCEAFKLLWGEAFPGPDEVLIEANKRSFTIGNLEPGHGYMISLVPIVNGIEQKPVYEQVKTLLYDLILPSIPLSLKMTSYGANWAFILWDSPDECLHNPGRCPLGHQTYQVHLQRETNSNQGSLLNTTETKFRLHDLIPRQTYSVAVRSLIGHLQSPWSLSFKFQVPAESEIMPMITTLPDDGGGGLLMNIMFRLPMDFEYIQNTFSINYLDETNFREMAMGEKFFRPYEWKRLANQQARDNLQITDVKFDTVYILQVNQHFYDGNSEIWPIFFYKTPKTTQEQGTWFKTHKRQYSLGELTPADLITLTEADDVGGSAGGFLIRSRPILDWVMSNYLALIIGSILMIILILLVVICQRVRRKPPKERVMSNSDKLTLGNESLSPSYMSERNGDASSSKLMMTPNSQRNQMLHTSISKARSNTYLEPSPNFDHSTSARIWTNQQSQLAVNYQNHSADMTMGFYPPGMQPNAGGLVSSTRYQTSSNNSTTINTNSLNKEAILNSSTHHRGQNSNYSKTPRVNANELISHTSSEDIRPMMASSALSDAFQGDSGAPLGGGLNRCRLNNGIHTSVYGGVHNNNSSTNSTNSTVSRRGPYAQNYVPSSHTGSIYQNNDLNGKLVMSKRGNCEGTSTIGSSSEVEGAENGGCKREKGAFSTNELKDEMANLEGLMKDLSSITKDSF